MRNLTYILVFVFFLGINAFSAHALEMYAVERADGVSVIYYEPSSKDTLGDVVRDIGLEGLPIRRVYENDLPDRADRDYWEMNDVPIGKKIKVNELKKQEAETKKAEKKQKVKDSRKKMCPSCTDADFDEAFGWQ